VAQRAAEAEPPPPYHPPAPPPASSQQPRRIRSGSEAAELRETIKSGQALFKHLVSWSNTGQTRVKQRRSGSEAAELAAAWNHAVAPLPLLPSQPPQEHVREAGPLPPPPTSPRCSRRGPLGVASAPSRGPERRRSSCRRPSSQGAASCRRRRAKDGLEEAELAATWNQRKRKRRGTADRTFQNEVLRIASVVSTHKIPRK
jgi:hypothetical protein